MKWFTTLSELALLVGSPARGLGPLDASQGGSTNVTVTPQPASPSDDISVTESRQGFRIGDILIR